MKIALALITFLTMGLGILNGKEKVRPEAVAGQFYPGDKASLVAMVKACFEDATDGDASGKAAEQNAVAVIVPHAGYIFSGPMAARAYSAIPADKQYDRIFLIGPSHHVWLEGASINKEYDFYSTPMGNVPVDKDLCVKLINKYDVFTFRRDAHEKEHCLEVQLPFLQYHLKNMPPIVPIIIGTESFDVIKSVATALKPYLNGRNLFVISSDFSHYPSFDDANVVDRRTAEAIVTGDAATFVAALQKNAQGKYKNLATSACGQSAILAFMLMTGGDSAYKYKHLGYTNSGTSKYGSKDEVVGYNSFVITKNADESAGAKGSSADKEGFSLTDNEKKTLLRIARNSIMGEFSNKSEDDSWAGETLTENLKQKCGAFVTLNKKGSLRGCIGHFGENIPVYKVVAAMARAAAFEDYRFPQVSKSEMNAIEIEISVLTPLKHIQDASEFNYGKEGIYMVKNGRSGTFLPQVADEVNWTKEEFLGHCAQDKAGIGWDGWKTADLYTYEAIIFKED
jgi:AmmeMemoRadiSam system protein B/AmmeMemoRadiSam system protein A